MVITPIYQALLRHCLSHPSTISILKQLRINPLCITRGQLLQPHFSLRTVCRTKSQEHHQGQVQPQVHRLRVSRRVALSLSPILLQSKIARVEELGILVTICSIFHP